MMCCCFWLVGCFGATRRRRGNGNGRELRRLEREANQIGLIASGSVFLLRCTGLYHTVYTTAQYILMLVVDSDNDN